MDKIDVRSVIKFLHLGNATMPVKSTMNFWLNIELTIHYMTRLLDGKGKIKHMSLRRRFKMWHIIPVIGCCFRFEKSGVIYTIRQKSNHPNDHK